MSKRRSARVVMLAAMLGSPLLSHGQVVGSWIGPSGASWTDPFNWTSNPDYPDGGEAWFSSTTGPIVLPGPVSVSSMIFSSIAPVSFTGPGSITLIGPAQIGVPVSSTYFEYVIPSGTSWTPIDGQRLGKIYGVDGLWKTGDGVLTLNQSSSFTGGVTISGGTLRVTSNLALGDPSNTITINGGTLDVEFSNNRSITVGPAGARFISNAASGGTLSGPISGTGTVTIASFSNIILRGQNTNTGTLNVVGRFLYTNLDRPGSLSNHDINIIGTHFFWDTDGLPVDCNVRLHSGWLEDTGGGSRHIGTLTLASSAGTIEFQGTSTQFSADGLQRENRGVGMIKGAGTLYLGNGTSLLIGGGGVAGSTNQSIIPYMVGPNYRAVTYNASGVRELTASEYLTFPDGTSVPAMVTTDNLSVRTVSFDNPVTVNSLDLRGSSTGSGTITVSSGLVTTGTFTIVSNSAPIQFGSNEGIIIAPNSVLTLSGPIYGTNGLTVFGDRVVNLSGTSFYTGETRLAGFTAVADVPASGPGPLGSDTSPVILQGTNAWLVGHTTFGRDLLVAAAPDGNHLTGPNVDSMTITGNIELQQWLAVGGTSTFSGDITGDGGLSIVRILSTSSPVKVTLTGDNSFTGGVDASGTVILGSDTAMGTGPVLISGTLMGLNGPRVVPNSVTIGSSLSLGGELTLAGSVSLNGRATTINVASDSAAETISGTLFGGTLVFGGNEFMGTLRLSGINHQLGTTVAAGTLAVENGAALGSFSRVTAVVGQGSISGTASSTLELSGGLNIPAHPLTVTSFAAVRSSGGWNVWNGPVSFSGSDFANAAIFDVSQGMFDVRGSFDFGSASLIKRGSGALVLPHLRAANVALDGGVIQITPNHTDTATSKVQSISVLSGGTIDLADNSMIVDYPDSQTDQDALNAHRTLLASGVIESSLADPTHQLVYVSNTKLGLTTFGGQNVDTSSVLIKYTYRGDANLDSVVDVADLLALAKAWQSTDIASGADFNYDGLIDIQDIRMLAANWGAGMAGPVELTLAPMLTSLGLPQTTIPEPNSCIILGMSAAICLRKRWRQ